MKTKTDWEKEEEERKRRTRGQIIMCYSLATIICVIAMIIHLTTIEQRAQFIAKLIGQEIPNYSDDLVLITCAPIVFCLLYPLRDVTITMTAGIRNTVVLSIGIIGCITTLLSHLYMAKVGWIHITGSVEELETLTRLGMKGLIDSLIVLTVQRILYTIARYKYGDNYQY